jgi:hypothetical protein
MLPELRGAVVGTVNTTDWNQVLTSVKLPRSQDWLQELGWLAHGFRLEASRLTRFAKTRQAFARAYLLGDFADANRHLEVEEETNGLSLWLAERELMLLQTKDGFAAHKARLSEIQGTVTNALVSYIITTTSTRLEPNVNPESFLPVTLPRVTCSLVRYAGGAAFALSFGVPGGGGRVLSLGLQGRKADPVRLAASGLRDERRHRSLRNRPQSTQATSQIQETGICVNR